MEKQGREVLKRFPQSKNSLDARKCHLKTCFMLLLTATLVLSFLLFLSDYLYNHKLPHRNMQLRLGPNNGTAPFIPVHHTLTVSAKEPVSAPVVVPSTNQIQRANLKVALQTKPMLARIPPDHPKLFFSRSYSFVLDEPETCNQQRPFLVLMVPVRPSGQRIRRVIRRTWGNESVVQGKVVSVLFMLGQPVGANAKKIQEMVQLESQEHHDLLQSNFMDTYRNLTIKTMLIMEWLATRCSNASYAMKIDSDMFLNVENLMTMLLAPSTPNENYITGMLMWNRPVIRDRNSKWFVPKDMYPMSVYPTYPHGIGYVFSNDLPEKFLRASKEVKPFNIEDAYIGVCAKHLGIKISIPPHPLQFRLYVGKHFNRDSLGKIIFIIVDSPHQLVNFWQYLKRLT